MSCICNILKSFGQSSGCQCDQRIHPLPLNIIAGLEKLPRQLAAFPEFRTAMLADIQSKDPLIRWRARDEDDLGLLLFEMWAYVCDSLTFYDEIIAQECYLRTATQKPSLRRLVDLLGYRPRPAIAAFAELAANATGKKEVMIPAGTAFRSGGFGEEAPQVFEVSAQTKIHPLTNKWKLVAPVNERIRETNPNYIFLNPTAEIKRDTVLLIKDSLNPLQNQAAVVEKVEWVPSIEGGSLLKVVFANQLRLSRNTLLSSLRVFKPARSVLLTTTTGSTNQVSLDGSVKDIRVGNDILIFKNEEYRWYKVLNIEERSRVVNNTTTINNQMYSISNKIPETLITLDSTINNQQRRRGLNAFAWSGSFGSSFSFFYDMNEAGRVSNLASLEVESSDDLQLSPASEMPLSGFNPTQFYLKDKNDISVKVEGIINYEESKLQLNDNENWSPSLKLPVNIFGNILNITRGETVTNEILGSGDSAIPNQSFKLKKKPLTYLNAPRIDDIKGVKNTLSIHVDGITWKEVNSFFGTTENDQIYIVRQNDEGDSILTFGDGVRGERLPNGRDNIVASYRFGAGAAGPPADSIDQINKPINNLQSVFNPLPSEGGSDPEPKDEIRKYAPKSVLILGRAVSIQDMEAVALSVPGILAVQTEWSWSKLKQRPVVLIWHIGESGVEELFYRRLRSVTAPTTPFEIYPASAIPVKLSIDIEMDGRYFIEDVLKEVRAILLDDAKGILAPANIGIGKPVFRSQLFDKVLSVEGTLHVNGIYWDINLNGRNVTPMTNYAQTPGFGNYFDLTENGILLLNGNDGL